MCEPIRISAIGEADGNIDNVRMVRRAKDFTEIRSSSRCGTSTT